MSRIKVELTPETQATLEELARQSTSSYAQTISDLMHLQVALQEIQKMEIPCIGHYEGLEIRNAAAINSEKWQFALDKHMLRQSHEDEALLLQLLDPEKEELRSELELSQKELDRLRRKLEEFQSRKARQPNSFVRHLYDSLILQPNFLGVGIDLKKAIATYLGEDSSPS